MKKIVRFFLIIFLLITITIIYARYGGTSGLITKEYKIESSLIGEDFDGLKVVHFSDLHYLRVTNNDKLKEIVDEINLINVRRYFYVSRTSKRLD